MEPPAASGHADPLDRLATVKEPWLFTWDWATVSRRPAGVLFVGLAPGFGGLYQLDIRAP